MGQAREVHVPDIGDFTDVPVIEVMVSPGDTVEAEQSLISLESDKATMDVPSPLAGVVREVKVGVGDTVSEGTLIALIETGEEADGEGDEGGEDAPGEAAAASTRESRETAESPSPDEEPSEAEPEPGREAAAAGEPARAPSPPAGRGEGATPDPRRPVGQAREPDPSTVAAFQGSDRAAPPTAALTEGEPAPGRFHATPAVRALARDLGVDLTRVTGTGRKGRILKDDVRRFVKHELSKPKEAAGGAIAPIPAVDFSRYGETEVQPLSRIQRLSGAHLHRAWLNVPHVTHHDEANVTELEAFRQSLKDEAAREKVRLTPLVFLMKALTACLREFPTFNASLGSDGETLVLKRYFHLGVAVDTPKGLVVPVIRDVDGKGLYALARELGEVSLRAREGKLKPDEMQGGCMSISSLGGIGGSGFTPIVNAPEVAILGVSRSRMTPVWDGAEFVPRLMLPLDLSYDHRVIDGAEAARFVARLCTLLGDVRRLLL